MEITWTTEHSIDFNPNYVFEDLKYEIESGDYYPDDSNTMVEDAIHYAVHNNLSGYDDCDFYALTDEVYEKCENTLLKRYGKRIKKLLDKAIKEEL